MAVQKMFFYIGKYGCYFLCVIYLAEKLRGGPVDILDAYSLATARGWMDEKCYMLKPEKLLGHLTNRTFIVRHAKADYIHLPEELEVIRYELREPMETLAHFVTKEYDPYGDSKTRLKGFVASKRIFTQVV
jgi:hypothetical protein